MFPDQLGNSYNPICWFFFSLLVVWYIDAKRNKKYIFRDDFFSLLVGWDGNVVPMVFTSLRTMECRLRTSSTAVPVMATTCPLLQQWGISVVGFHRWRVRKKEHWEGVAGQWETHGSIIDQIQYLLHCMNLLPFVILGSRLMIFPSASCWIPVYWILPVSGDFLCRMILSFYSLCFFFSLNLREREREAPAPFFCGFIWLLPNLYPVCCMKIFAALN